MFERQLNTPLVNPGLQTEAGNTLVEAANAFLYKVQGNIPPKTTAGQNMPALTGTIPTANQAAYAFYSYYDTNTAAHVYTVAKSDNFSTSVQMDFGADFPMDDDSQCIIGRLHIVNTSGSTFTGNTTALNVAGIATTYINNFGVNGA